MAVKYAVRLTAVRDLCQLLICERGVFDLSSAQVELLRRPPLPTDLQGHTHTLPSLHIPFFFFFYPPALELLLMLKVRRRSVTREEVKKREGG